MKKPCATVYSCLRHPSGTGSNAASPLQRHGLTGVYSTPGGCTESLSYSVQIKPQLADAQIPLFLMIYDCTRI